MSYLKIQENILRQKAKVRCLVNGDTNSTYFHMVIQYWWRRTRINKLLDEYQQWVQGNANVSEIVAKYFKGISCQVPNSNYFQAFEGINIIITDDINYEFTTVSMEKDIKTNLMTMDLDSVPGPEGFTNSFFHTWRGVVDSKVTIDLLSIF